MIPKEFAEEHDLESIAVDGYVYAEVQGGMHGLPHAGAAACKELKAHLELKGYRESTVNPGLWFDNHSTLSFTLIVDDFGVKYATKKSAERLITTLQNKYETPSDWAGSTYCGASLKWDYTNGTVTCSIPNCIKKFLERIKCIPASKKQHTPCAPQTTHCGHKSQEANEDKSPRLTSDQIRDIQSIAGATSHHARLIDSTIVVAANDFSQQ